MDICSLNTAKMHKFRVRYEADSAQNIFNVSGNDIQIVGYTIIYLHNNDFRKPLKVAVARNLGRGGEVIMSLRTLRRMGAIPDEWPVIDETNFAEWDETIYNNLDTEFDDEVNKVITEGASSHDKVCEEARPRIIKQPLKVFADELNSNLMKMEPVSVKFTPDAVKPKVAYTAHKPPMYLRPAVQKLIQDLLKDEIFK